ncbi:transaldolase [Micrococcoides hystricis]|uniref:Transaldolase n=1 Tax=Micrococcoides hystricis TaxID=1572761 RepID=A0ABV6P9C9_9MICC
MATANNENAAAITEAGVSLWLDDLDRTRLTTGNLQEMMTEFGIRGVTTNPAIFQNALKDSSAYQEQLAKLAESGADAERAVTEVTSTDVALACDQFADLYNATGGQDGRVSLEVDPRLAHDTANTVKQAKDLAVRVGRPNVMIKIPATEAGLAAITEVIGEGISVNVTLIFSLGRYREVINAYLLGLEKAHAAGIPLNDIHSVASFFVSRLDTKIDALLPADSMLRGKAGVANAQLAYQIFEQSLETERWKYLAAQGANLQRPLWASTGVKDPALPDTLYVDELIAPHTVNTLPEKTLRAFADHGTVTENYIQSRYAEAEQLLSALKAAGVSYQRVVEELESEGIDKFTDAWAELLDSVQQALDAYYH